MSQTTVIIGFAEAMAAPEVVWSLIDHGFRVIAFARQGRHSALRNSRHVTCHDICAPEVDLQKALSDLESLVGRIQIEAGDGGQLVLFPLDDKGVWLASRLRRSEEWILAGPGGSQAELALNKCVQTRLAQEAGFNVPHTGFARTAAEVFAFVDKEVFPVILKAADSVPIWQGHVHSCRKYICGNEAELKRAITEWGEKVPLLIQPFVTGVGEGLFGLAAPESIRAWSAHRRLRMMNPQGSGSSACISKSVPADLKATAEELIRKVEWRGVFMIELLRDQAGKLWFVELNGRPWGSISLSRRQGLEYPSWHVSLALDQRSQAGMTSSSSEGVVCRNVGREFMHLLFVLKGAKSKALRNWPGLWQTMKSVIWIHPGDTYYNWRRDDSKVFFADCYYTIHDNLFKEKY